MYFPAESCSIHQQKIYDARLLQNEITFPEYLPEQSCNITMKKKLHEVHLTQSKIEPCF